MAFPVGLGLYLLATARRSRAGAGGDGPRPGRPSGPLIWFPLETGADGGASGAPPGLPELLHHIRDSARAPEVLVTRVMPEPAPAQREHGTEGAGAADLPEDIWQVPAPPPTLPDIRAFLRHWRPDLIVLTGDALPAALIHEAGRAGIPVHWIDARPPRAGHPRRFPGVLPTLLQSLSLITAPDAGSARALRRLGAPQSRMTIGGALHEAPVVLPHVEAEREALALLAKTRPIWLAACLPQAEEAAVIEAHRLALRRAHRLLLIVVPRDPSRADTLIRKMEIAEGWTVARRSSDEEPEEEVQAYVADTEGEMGLWYRLAPITYLGGSLSEGVIRSPLEPAALGSAIVHGPEAGRHGAALSRLAAARAARAVQRAQELGEAVSDLIAPDRAAALAHNAWEASTAGAEVADRLAASILGALPAQQTDSPDAEPAPKADLNPQTGPEPTGAAPSKDRG
ncbi:3-deoxy-D-manno-octulosonic acid transferase [Acidimangrovimonas sediminis]|uniref:3-deoxy-D-manno-octulosonic acid transferase n=1 Tax=Acidimangrovimonas sediminis TaxID=2056283 RepID=UPI000C80E991|nr:glycosyltransferase N-terminal domain-containing protein [Acidimangrovimonas sediminis]